MRFGIFDHMEMNGPLKDLYEGRLQLLELADEAGFWCYHKAEHHFTVLDGAPSSNVFLAAASQRTSKIRLGSLVMLLPFYNPLRLIEEVSVLDHLTKGRLEIGVGKGVSPVEHRLWGLDPNDARQRFEDSFAILREGLQSNHLAHAGLAFDHEVPVRHRPLQEPHPPFWYPGNIDYAGEHRLSTMTGGPVPALSARIARYRSIVDGESAADWSGGHPPTIGVTAHVYVAETDAAANARVAVAFPRYNDNLVSLWDAYDTPLPNGGPSLQGGTGKARALQILIAGSPDTVRDYVRNLDQTGAGYFAGAFQWGDLTAAEAANSLDLFAGEVMSHFD